MFIINVLTGKKIFEMTKYHLKAAVQNKMQFNNNRIYFNVFSPILDLDFPSST